MSVKLVKGDSYGIVRENIAENIKQNLSQNIKNYLVVPDDIISVAKKEFMRLMQEDCVFGLKVVSFAGLAEQFVSHPKKILSNESGLLIFKSVAKANKEKLKSFAKIIDNDGAMRELFALSNLLEESRIICSNLVAAGADTRGILGAKVEDIALLRDKYRKEVEKNYADKHTLMKSLANYFESCGALSDCKFYFCDFGLMTAEQLEVMRALAVSGSDMAIGVVANEKADNSRIYPRFICSEPIGNKSNYQDLCTILRENYGVKIDIEECGHEKNTEKSRVISGLFGYNAIGEEDYCGNITVHSAENVNLEVKAVCREIRKLVVEERARYKDICIYCADIDKYKGDFERELEVFEISYFMQSKTPLTNFAVAKLLIDGIAVRKSGYQKSKVLAFSKNILLAISKEDISSFELFVDKYNVDGEQFLSPFEGVSGEQLLEVANCVRQKLMDILDTLECDCTCATQVATSIEEFYQKIFEESDYNDYLLKLQSTQGIGKRRNAETAKTKILEIIDTLQSIELKNGLDYFDCVTSIVQNTRIGGGKQMLDSVFVTSNAKAIFDTKYLFVVGANDGVFAPESSNISLFTFSELEKLEKCGVNFCPNIMDINYNSKFEAVQLLAKGNRVYVSFAQSQGEPALVLKNLCDLFKIKIVPYMSDANKIGMDFAKYATKIGTKSNAKRELSLYYSERMRGIATGEEKVFDYLYTRLEDKYKYQNLIKPKDLKYVRPNTLGWSKSGDKTFASISALERYFNCPFKFYCERILRLKKSQRGELDAIAIGNFVHRILEKLFKRNKNFDMTDDELYALVDTLCGETIKEKEFEVLTLCMSENVLKNSLFKKVHYIADKLVRIARRTDFETISTELTFGFDYSKLPPYEIKSGDKSYFIRGKIDRIDKFGDYVAIVDYKTASKVNYTLKEVYYGERVQLLIYLNAYLKGSKVKPFALLYMPLPHTYASDEESKAFAYSGLVRNAGSVFPHFDSEFQNKKVCALPLSYKRDGEVSEKGLLSENDLSILLDYADKVVVQAIKEIESGYIEAKPTDCAGCEYGQICLSKNDTAKTRHKLSKTAFSIKEEKEVDDGEN